METDQLQEESLYSIWILQDCNSFAALSAFLALFSAFQIDCAFNPAAVALSAWPRPST